MLVFLIHANFAVTTVLSNVLSNHFFQQNKLTITFKMTTSVKSDWSYPSCQMHAKALPVTHFGWSWTTVPIG